jgi:hypothetical protein
MSERLDFYETESGVIRPHPTVSFAPQSNKFGLAITTAPGIATIKIAVNLGLAGVEAGVHAYIRMHPCQLSPS